MIIQHSKSISEQVLDFLRSQIVLGVYAPNTQLPSESALAEQLKISRGSVRSALLILETEGLIVRKQGSGTFVRGIDFELSTLVGKPWELFGILESSGIKVTVKILSNEKRAVDENEAVHLRIEPGTEVLAIKRLFFANEKPIMLSQIIIPCQNLIAGNGFDISIKSIQALLTGICGQQVRDAVVRISAIKANQEVALMLVEEAGAAVIQREELFLVEDGSPLAYSLNYLHGSNSIRFRLRLQEL